MARGAGSRIVRAESKVRAGVGGVPGRTTKGLFPDIFVATHQACRLPRRIDDRPQRRWWSSACPAVRVAFTGNIVNGGGPSFIELGILC